MSRSVAVCLALLLAACNLAVPQVTPTVAPSLMPSNTLPVSQTPTAPARTATAVALVGSPTATRRSVATDDTAATASVTPHSTSTPPPTRTPTVTPGASPDPSPTLLPLLTRTATPTRTPSVTPTPAASRTPTASTTPEPPTPTAPPPTATLAPSPTGAVVIFGPTIHPPVTFTPTARSSPTPVPQALPLTPVDLGLLPTPTPLTPMPGPTLAATPTFITLNAPAVAAAVSPVAATTTPETGPTPTALPLSPTATATAGLLPIVTLPPARQIIIPETIAYTLSASGGVYGVQPFDLAIAPTLFAQNPANPNQYIAVNGAGQMFFVHDYARDDVQRVPIDIFTEYTYEVTERDDNDAAVVAVAWSNDGALAFIVDGDKVNKDGVWLWHPAGGDAQLLRDCPPQPGCDTVLETPGIARWESRGIDWSPDGGSLLIRVYLPDEGRSALLVASRHAPNPESVPGPLLRFDDGTWSADGGRLAVAGRGDDGRIVLGTIRPAGSDARLTDMGALGYTWIQDPVAYDGQVYALGSRSGPNSPQQLVSAAGEALTGPIGSAPPERVSWSPDRSAVLVVTREGGGRRYFVADVNRRAAQEISAQVASALAVEWVGEPPG